MLCFSLILGSGGWSTETIQLQQIVDQLPGFDAIVA